MAEQSSNNEKYDIHIKGGPRALQKLSDLVADLGGIISSRTLDRISSGEAGFLGLDLPVEDAVVIFKRLFDSSVWGIVVPSAYRYPKLTPEMAYPIAEQAIKERYASRFPGVSFGPIKFAREEPMVYEFLAASDELPRLGWSEPAAVFASVDKLDGHVWEEFEFAHYLESIGLEWLI